MFTGFSDVNVVAHALKMLKSRRDVCFSFHINACFHMERAYQADC